MLGLWEGDTVILELVLMCFEDNVKASGIRC